METENSPVKECPYCGEEIQACAKKCRYCGEWLEEISDNGSFVDVPDKPDTSVPHSEPDAEKSNESQESEKKVLNLGNYINKFLGWVLIGIGIVLGLGNIIIYHILIDGENQIDNFILGPVAINIMVPAVLLLFYHRIKDTEAGPRFLKPMAIGIALHIWWIISLLAGIETSSFVDWVEYFIFLGSFLAMALVVMDYSPISVVAGGLMIYPILDILSSILLDTNWVYDVFITLKHNKELYLPELIYIFNMAGLYLFFRYFGDFYRGKGDDEEDKNTETATEA